MYVPVFTTLTTTDYFGGGKFGPGQKTTPNPVNNYNKTGLQPVSRPVEQVPLVHPICRKQFSGETNMQTGLAALLTDEHLF